MLSQFFALDKTDLLNTLSCNNNINLGKRFIVNGEDA